MDGDLTQFLERHEPRTGEIVDWGDMPLRITSYITSECSPLAYVTSVRALVIGRDTVLTLFDGVGTHILPGGRRETDESLEETLHREVLEETGYTLANPRPLGFIHLRHLGPKPKGYSYPYPDFLQMVYVARAGEFVPDRMVEDPYVKRSELMAATDVLEMPIPPGERMFLRAALKSGDTA